MFFQPLTNYVITRQIYNERDFGQKYVKAWVSDAATDDAISDAATGVSLDGVEMTEVDSLGKFKYTFKLPDDSSGTGRILRIKTVVYSDSGYTTKDVNYSVEENTIVVRDMVSLGGGGGGSIDYEYLTELVKKVVKQEIGQIPAPKEVVLPDVKKMIDIAQKSILSEIKGIQMPDIPKEVEKKVLVWEKPDLDLSPVLDNLKDSTKQIIKFVKDKEIPKTDLSKIEKHLSELGNNKKDIEKIVGEIPIIVVPVGKITMLQIKKSLDEAFNKERKERDKDTMDILESINEIK